MLIAKLVLAMRMPVLIIGFFLLSFVFLSGAMAFEGYLTDPVLIKAAGLLKEKMAHDAIAILSRHKPDRGSLGTYHLLYAKAMEAARMPLEAIEHLRLAYIYSNEQGLKELAYIERADTYLKIRYFDEARYYYAIFIKRFPQSEYISRAYLGLAKALFGLGEFQESIGYFDKSKDTAEAIFGKANALQAVGKVDEASVVYNIAISKWSSYIKESEESIFYLGENYRSRGRLHDAKSYLSLLRQGSYKERATLSLGGIAIEESKIDSAMKHFILALSSRNLNIRRSALINIAKLEIRSGNIDKAKSVLNEIRNKYPYGRDYDDAMLMLSSLYVNEDRFKDAISVLNEIIFRINPSNDALNEMEKILSIVKEKDKGQFINAWRFVGKWLINKSREGFLIDITPSLRQYGKPFFDICNYLIRFGSDAAKTKAFIMLADFYISIGDINNASKYIGMLRDIRYAGDDILRLQARLLYATNQYDAAIEKLNSIKDIDEEGIRLFGNLLFLSSKPMKFLDRYKGLIKQKGKTADTYIIAADILSKDGNKKEAIEYYRLALAKDPENKWVLYRLGTLSDTNGSEEMLKQIKNDDPMLSSLVSVKIKEINVYKRIKGILDERT